MSDAIASAHLTPRYDLQFEVVAFTYEVRTAGGALAPTKDIHPPSATGNEFNALIGTFDFLGPTGAGESVTVDSELLPTDRAGWVEWLKEKFEWLSEAHVTDVFTVGALPAPTLPYELLPGAPVPEWTGYSTARDRIAMFVVWSVTDDGDPAANPPVAPKVIEQHRNKRMVVRITTTDAPPGSYNRVTSSDSGDTLPIGLAAYVHSSVSVLHYEGELRTQRAEVNGALRPGIALNLSGGQPEWLSMNALIQSIEEDIDAGETTVRFGPPGHMGPQDVIELLRITRPRRIYTAPESQTGSNELPGTDLSGEDSDESLTHGQGWQRKMIFKPDLA